MSLHKCMSVELKQFEKVYHMTSGVQRPQFIAKLVIPPKYRLHRRWRFNEGALYLQYLHFFFQFGPIF